MPSGIIVPLVTPFREDGSVCRRGVAALSEMVEPHVTAVAPCLTTGEGWRLSKNQWVDMIRYCLDRFGADRVIAGIELSTTADAVARVRLACELGCRAVIAAKPLGGAVTQEQIWRHYKALAASNQALVFVYNEVWLSGNTIQPATYARLAAIPQIAGIKESGGDPEMTAWLTQHKEQLPAVFQGREELMQASQGLDGFMVALANLAPELCERAYRQPYEEVWEELSALCVMHELLSDGWIGAIKKELARRGIIGSSSLTIDFHPSASAAAARPSEARA